MTGHNLTVDDMRWNIDLIGAAAAQPCCGREHDHRRERAREKQQWPWPLLEPRRLAERQAARRAERAKRQRGSSGAR